MTGPFVLPPARHAGAPGPGAAHRIRPIDRAAPARRDDRRPGALVPAAADAAARGAALFAAAAPAPHRSAAFLTQHISQEWMRAAARDPRRAADAYRRAARRDAADTDLARAVWSA